MQAYSHLSNWTIQGTAKWLEEQLINFTFKGTGIYHTEGHREYLVIFPIEDNGDVIIRSKTKNLPEDQVYSCHCYGDDSFKMMMNYILSLPTFTDAS